MKSNSFSEFISAYHGVERGKKDEGEENCFRISSREGRTRRALSLILVWGSKSHYFQWGGWGAVYFQQTGHRIAASLSSMSQPPKQRVGSRFSCVHMGWQKQMSPPISSHGSPFSPLKMLHRVLGDLAELEGGHAPSPQIVLRGKALPSGG